MFNIYRILFLALKKVQIVKIATPQILTTQPKNPPKQNFNFPIPLLGDRVPQGFLPPRNFLENPAQYCVFTSPLSFKLFQLRSTCGACTNFSAGVRSVRPIPPPRKALFVEVIVNELGYNK